MSLFNINKETVLYQGGLLGLTAGLATLLLLLLYSFTAETIELRHREDQLAGLDQVIPSDSYANDLLQSQYQWQSNGKSYQVFIGKDSDNLVTGYAVQVAAQGFSGPITLLIGLDEKLTILGVRVLSHTETPGLGDKIEIARNDWIRSFEGHSLSNTNKSAWGVKKDGGQFDQFTGATITPRAIVKEVHQSLLVMNKDMVKIQSQEAKDHE